jgi:signal peptidase I
VDEAVQKPVPRSRARRILRALGISVGVLALLVGAVVLVADAMDIEPYVQTGHAMIPAIPARTRFLRIPYRGAKPARGELVLVRDAFGSGQIVRRVIAVPGDGVALEGFAPRVNGRMIGRRVACPRRLAAMTCMRETLGTRSWTVTWSKRARAGRVHALAHVPRGYYYVLADHRDAARDSRDPLFGALPEHAVLGSIFAFRR